MTSRAADEDALLVLRLDARPRALAAVSRDRLLALLDAAADVRLILVAAPAGFGKSTLLAGWTSAWVGRCAWLSLDAGDDDLVRFTGLLAAAIIRLGGASSAAADRDPTRPFDPDLALGGLLADLAAAAAAAPDGVVVVLDDYHVLSDPAIHAFTGRLIERLPPGVRVVLSTRADPPIALARLRAGGEMLEIRADALRFTPSEAAQLLRTAGLDLDEASISELITRTEGWAAVLRLAAVALQGRPDAAGRVRTFGASHRFVLDYVVEEVLDGLSSDVQEFLCRTAVLDRLCGPLCDAVTGRDDGQAMLEALERANLLTIPLDDERRWYRYHALFADVLRARLTMADPGLAPHLHARAAAWLLAHGDDDGAVSHALRADDAELACMVVAEASIRRLNAGALNTVSRWLDALPPDLVRGDPQLCTLRAWGLVLPGVAAGTEDWLAASEAALRARKDGGLPPGPGAMPPGHGLLSPEGAILAQHALIRSRLADLEGDPGAAIAHARAAAALVPADLPPDAHATLRGDATILLARGLAAAGDLDAAAEAYEASIPDLRAGGNRFAVDRAIADLAVIAIARGDPASAVARCEAELDRSGDTAGGAVWSALARARHWLGRYDAATAAATRALELATRAGDAQVVRSARATLELIEAATRGGPGRRDVPGPDGSADHGLVEPLTPRELEVLRLVALGRSNRQVADELFVTVATVKSHLHTISGKLDASNRVEAVARAREVGLLG